MIARRLLTFALVATALLAMPRLTAAQGLDLTGMWQDEHGTRYRVRQVGPRLYWAMESPRVSNVFSGTIAGTTITGDWADVPGGELRNAGQLALRIESSNRFVKIGESLAYGGTIWTRQGVTAQGPASYLGCFRDQGDPSGTAGRDLAGAVVNNAGVTTETCLQFCQQRGFTYAGTQYSSWCFCGNSYGRSGIANNCDMKCSGNASQTCGGAWANSVYRASP
jgi:hypothetical protein